ncbi:choice-of-anchor P family protein [Comamonas sp. B-9]|uniref:choice-of-anchor P family protein n=1 Tax=Comamonas sp. B-9 TaxID=1055192 RepID=UPI0011DD7B09|nr:choice-of-anchor P family protein [Comamonas sp. B-9]
MNPLGAQRSLRRLLYGGLASMALVCSSAALAASSGAGRAYGLQVTADVLGAGLGIPFADTGSKTAPPDFNTPMSVASVGVTAGVNLLSVGTGVINASTQSNLAQNSVVSDTSVDGLNLSLAMLSLGANTISSQARMACVNGLPVGSGDAQILGGTGALSGVSAAVNGLVNLTVGVPGLGTEVGVKLYTNEQSQSGTTMSVTALRIELVAKALTLPLLSASVVVGNSTASMPDCKPTVTLNPLPAITASNQSSLPISGSCSAGSGNVAISSNPAGVSQSLPCSAGGSYAGAVNAQGLPDGTVTITATQTASGQSSSASQSTSKNTGSVPQLPVVAVVAAPQITAANQATYTVSGTCSANGEAVAVMVGSVSVSALCGGGVWSASGINVSGLPDGAVTVTASQTVAGQTGSGSLVTGKDATAPAVAITSAPVINAANQSSYGVAGSCSENGVAVTVRVGMVAAVPQPVCSSGIWSTSGMDVSGLPAGAVTVTAMQTDAAGNTGNASRTTSKDSSAAAVTVVVAPRINSGNQASYGGVSGACSAAGGAVTVAIGSISNTAACTGGNWTLSAVDVRSLPEGTVVVKASQTVAGTVISGTLNTVKDTTAPAVSISTAPTIDTSNQNAYSPAGTCTSGDGAVTVSVGSIKVTVACVNGSWTAPGMQVGALPKGPVTVTASQTDEAGNTGSSSREVTKTSDPNGELPAGLIAAQSGTWIIKDELNGEPGRGMGIDIQDGVLFMQVYNYRATGAPTFHTALGSLHDNTVTAPLYYYEGGRFFGSEQRDGHEAGSPGNVVITFTSRTTGTIQFPGEPTKVMQRFDYEGTPAGVFSDPAFVDRWAMVELNSSNQPVRSWWADIGTGEQVPMSGEWAAAAMAWPYPANAATTVHGFGGTLSGHVVAQCSYSGAGLVFNCAGNRTGGAGSGAVVSLTLQRGVDQISGSLQEGGGDARRLVGFRVARAAYTAQNNQNVRTSYYAPGYAPESGTWVVSSELRGLPGRGLPIELQKPVTSEDHMLFMSVYDYESDGQGSFHSLLGAHDASTTPAPNTPDLSTVQYQGGRYFGGPAAIASFKADAGLTRSIHFTAPSVGTLAFPGEQPVQIERFYYGVNKASAQSLRGSWVLLSQTDAMPSRNFRFQTRDANSVIDADSGYVCVAQVLRQFNFHCTGPSGSPAFRFVAGFYGASTGIVGDAEDAPVITVVRVTDPNGEMVQAGD